MDAIVKASLYIGTILLVGAGVYFYFISLAFDPKSEKESKLTGNNAPIRLAVLTGFLLIAVGSILNLVLALSNVLGSRMSAAFLLKYAQSSQHGHMSFVRLALACVLLVLVSLRNTQFVGKNQTLSRAFFAFCSIGFLATFSILSHATAMNGQVAFWFDLVHLSAASVWVGALVFALLSKIWMDTFFRDILARISSTALVCVVLLVITGIYTSRIHIASFSLLFTSPYGQILLLKIVVFTVILLLAAFNRWYFMPKLSARKNGLVRVLALEVCLLITVLCLTGLLTMTAVPHD